MIDLALQVFGISVEVTFSAPRPFFKERLDREALWLTDVPVGFAVAPEQIRLRPGDALFAYDLLAILLGGNGFFFLNAQKVNFTAKNAKTRADADLLFQMTRRFLQQFATPERLEAVFTANAQATVNNPAIRERFFEPFKVDPRIAWPGAAGYLSVEGWTPNIRFQVEAGIDNPSGVFLTWTTKIVADALSDDPNRISSILQSAAGIYGINFQSLT
jgi:hypothetical protein